MNFELEGSIWLIDEQGEAVQRGSLPLQPNLSQEAVDGRQDGLFSKPPTNTRTATSTKWMNQLRSPGKLPNFPVKFFWVIKCLIFCPLQLRTYLHSPSLSQREGKNLSGFPKYWGNLQLTCGWETRTVPFGTW